MSKNAVSLPVMPALLSIRDGGEDWLSVPEDSRWFANWRVVAEVIR